MCVNGYQDCCWTGATVVTERAAVKFVWYGHVIERLPEKMKIPK